MKKRKGKRRIFFDKPGDPRIYFVIFDSIQEGIDWCEENGYRFLHAGLA